MTSFSVFPLLWIFVVNVHVLNRCYHACAIFVTVCHSVFGPKISPVLQIFTSLSNLPYPTSVKVLMPQFVFWDVPNLELSVILLLVLLPDGSLALIGLSLICLDLEKHTNVI